MFNKLVAIEPVSLILRMERALHLFAKEVVLYPDVPKDDAEIVVWIGDADAVLLSYTSRLEKGTLENAQREVHRDVLFALFSRKR